MSLLDWFPEIEGSCALEHTSCLLAAHEPPDVDFDIWHKTYYRSNSLEVCITLDPKLWTPLSTWANTHATQIFEFSNFINKECKDRIYYFVTEFQSKTNNCHWHGIMTFKDYHDKHTFIMKCKKKFGRTAINPIRNERYYYNYIHKESPLGTIIVSHYAKETEA